MKRLGDPLHRCEQQLFFLGHLRHRKSEAVHLQVWSPKAILAASTAARTEMRFYLLDLAPESQISRHVRRGLWLLREQGRAGAGVWTASSRQPQQTAVRTAASRHAPHRTRVGPRRRCRCPAQTLRRSLRQLPLCDSPRRHCPATAETQPAADPPVEQSQLKTDLLAQGAAKSKRARACCSSGACVRAQRLADCTGAAGCGGDAGSW